MNRYFMILLGFLVLLNTSCYRGHTQFLHHQNSFEMYVTYTLPPHFTKPNFTDLILYKKKQDTVVNICMNNSVKLDFANYLSTEFKKGKIKITRSFSAPVKLSYLFKLGLRRSFGILDNNYPRVLPGRLGRRVPSNFIHNCKITGAYLLNYRRDFKTEKLYTNQFALSAVNNFFKVDYEEIKFKCDTTNFFGIRFYSVNFVPHNLYVYYDDKPIPFVDSPLKYKQYLIAYMEENFYRERTISKGGPHILELSKELPFFESSKSALQSILYSRVLYSGSQKDKDIFYSFYLSIMSYSDFGLIEPKHTKSTKRKHYFTFHSTVTNKDYKVSIQTKSPFNINYKVIKP